MSTRADYGHLPDPCPECGRKNLRLTTSAGTGELHVVLSFRACGALWIDGERSRLRWVPG